ncbi:hypothetical protein JVT61DRAFT_12047 [Boletus reticuloceps]|uniref:Uncharacterized protein n=1 Tax=Boletus reticuloceps TaxID=495285 RepID=A0A8I2YEI8_9AGAM|nr:hypothetical protein JVT61DRAFT_12047 [Boletus reticuloceps]
MESILEHCRSNCTSSWVENPDVGGGAAKLYLLNGGTWPPMPAVGDFAYNLEDSTVHVYDKEVWKKFTIQDFTSTLWNPTGNRSIVYFTHRELPFWMCLDEDDYDTCEFSMVDALIQGFIQCFDPAKTHVSISERPKRRREAGAGAEAEDGTEEDVKARWEWDDAPCKKHPRLAEDLTCRKGDRSLSRFIDSSVGFPEDTPRIRWQGGYTTYLPFAGMGTKQDVETMLVKELASGWSLEGSNSGSEPYGSSPDALQVGELVVEIELDCVL